MTYGNETDPVPAHFRIDIAPMKLNAITGNGTRLKNFIDLVYPSSPLTLAQMIHAFEEKDATRHPAMVIIVNLHPCTTTILKQPEPAI